MKINLNLYEHGDKIIAKLKRKKLEWKSSINHDEIISQKTGYQSQSF